MRYELDFIGIKDGAKDADAICFRYYDYAQGRFVVGVYDGGLQSHGVALCEHLNTYYFSEGAAPFIDYVICSHPDQDHASGLIEILENFPVRRLFMNIPWLYVDELYSKVADKRITKDSLERSLRDSYPYIDQLETLAREKGIAVKEGFQGTMVGNQFTILSPSKDFYLQLLAESSKTPLQESAGGRFTSLVENFKTKIESWFYELLRNNVRTSAENESSIIILGDMEEEKFLLTGDAGVRALECAANYAESNICSLKEVLIHQIPHHGGRHNVSPTILNRIVGDIIAKGTTTGKIAIVSVADGSDHPRKMVTNAYIRRGVRVYETRCNTFCHSYGDMPVRLGWGSAVADRFSEEVEDWDD